MKKNNLSQSVIILLLSLVFLFVFSLLPEFSFLSVRVKKISILEDILETKKDSVFTVDTVIHAKDTIVQEVKKVSLPKRRKGSLEMEDFGPGNLSYFFDGLAKSKSEPVRVAFFGDSFIEGDILVAPLRDTLQRIFGGKGVGYVPITSEINMFRTSIQHTYAGWQTYSMNGMKSAQHHLGMAGYCFRPLEGNYVEYRPGYHKAALPFVKFFYKSKSPSSISVTSTIDDTKEYALIESDTIQEFTIPGKNYDQVSASFTGIEDLSLYGAAIEDSVGISIDNFSMRSNPGLGLGTISDEMFQQFNSLRDYKLVVLQYGLNVLNDSTRYIGYELKMVDLINRLKTLFPQSSFLLLSVSDRCTKQGTEMKTMPGVFVLRDVQRRIAYKCNIAFWDLFEGMGGEDSMVKYTEANPPLGAKDYTHLTFKGGRKIAKRFADALLKQKKKYEKI